MVKARLGVEWLALRRELTVAILQPFNAFLSGFSATVGQFVLTASLRIQTNPENKNEFGSLSHERYVAKYVTPQASS